MSPLIRIEPLGRRTALGRFANGVVVVTDRAADDRPVGLTVNSFAPISLEPPLLAQSLAARLGSLPAFLVAPCLPINVLAEDQEAVARRFAGPNRAVSKAGQMASSDDVSRLP
jgi:flavin reductase (DIM6/NTAB) family NADH-FMN oxidoreductase RutF